MPHLAKPSLSDDDPAPAPHIVHVCPNRRVEEALAIGHHHCKLWCCALLYLGSMVAIIVLHTV